MSLATMVSLTSISTSSLSNRFVIFFVLFRIIPYATPLNFGFQSFSPSYYQELKLGGNATFSSKQPAIEITENPSNTSSFGRVMYYQPLHLWSKDSDYVSHFTTYFSFIIDSQNSSKYADGMAFFIAGTNFPLPTEPSGSTFGLLSRNQTLLNSTKDHFVAVEFDTFQNEWDPGYKHVAIDINNMLSRNFTDWLCGVEQGRKNEAWISYNFTKKMLNATFTGFKGSKTVYQTVVYEVDLRDYLPEWVSVGISAATGNLYETHTLLSWNFSSTAGVSPYQKEYKRNGKSNTGLIAGLCTGGFVLLMVGLLFLWFILWKKYCQGDTEEDRAFDESMKERLKSSSGPKKFSYRELVRATSNFSEKEKLGEGGFGGVFRGYLKKPHSCVAVKRVSRDSKQGLKEFVSEVLIISRIRHRNLVHLVGWCHEKHNFLLVYEFMSNGSLDSYLFKKENSLSWELRYKIALGLASALLYLHEGWEECVVHRDIKSSNVLLDSNFNAKLGDFGLARLVDHCKGSRTTILAGTMGYMSPEYATTGKASKESDVYSFGIVALEIACGRKPIDPMAKEGQVIMVKWIWELYGAGRLLDAADKRLLEEFDKQQMECLMIVGIWCAHPDYSQRPSMRQVIQVLQFEALPPTLSLNTPVAASIFDLLDATSTTGGSYAFATSSCSHSSILTASQITSSSRTGSPKS